MTPRLALAFFLCLSIPALAAPTVTEEQAAALLRDGKTQEALAAFDAIIASRPADPSAALYYSAQINLVRGDWQKATPMLEKLVRLRPGSFPSWELMVQAYQAAGETEDRDAAIEALYDAWHSSLDPAIQSATAYTRDRIAGPKHTLLAREMLDPGGDDVARLMFIPADQHGEILHLILLRTDSETNSRWREKGTISSREVVYHLDTVEQLIDGHTSDRSYEFYVQLPDYDTVRELVQKILDGTVQPLNGPADPYWTSDSVK